MYLKILQVKIKPCKLYVLNLMYQVPTQNIKQCTLDVFQPFLGSGEASNRVIGKLKMGSDTLATLEGHWDTEVFIKDKTTKVRLYC